MSDLYTTAQEAEKVARRACTGDGYMRCECGPHHQLSDHTRFLGLAAAEACDSMAWVAREMEDECDGSLLLHEAAAAIAEDYAARATAWFRVAGAGEEKL